MALNAKHLPKQNKKNDFPEQPEMEAGTYPARLVQIIDLGLQNQRPFTKGGKVEQKPPAHEIMLTYEFVDCFMVDENGDDITDKPRWVSETLPWYGIDVDRAKSAQRYKAFDPKCVHEGDFAQLIGEPTNVTVTINKKEDRTYTNIASISEMRARDAAKCPELVNTPKVFDLSEPDMDVFNALPEWIQNKIKNNLEYGKSALQELLEGKAEKKPAKPAKAKPEPVDEEEEDYLPF